MASSADRKPGRSWHRIASLGLATALLTLIVTVNPWIAATAEASPSMQSTGSSFASVAIQEWVGQASTLFGLNLNWQVSSSVVGLNNFAQNQVDFAASDIPYSSQQSTYYPNTPYQYMPDVAGGLAFMYNLNGNDGQQITSLNLDAAVIDDIFLGKIAKWNNPAIVSLNQSLSQDLPNQTIIPVFRSDASGENYLLSDYLLHQDAATFNQAQQDFQSGGVGLPSATWPIPSGSSNINPSTYPNWATQTPVGQSGSDNAANYVAALSSVGSITYVETAYAKEHNFPVASVMNASGATVQPTSLNVATAMEAAILHPDLTQDLTNVYSNPLPNSYPLSAYSYIVSPCSPSLAATQGTSCAGGPDVPSTFPSQKGQALGQFVGYLACAGQEKMALLGYSPLPPNLVSEDFDAIGRLNGGVQPPAPTAANCKNPYVDGEIPLPGEPAVTGQAGGGLNPTTTAAAAAGGATGASGSSGSSSTSGSGSGSSSGGPSGSGGASSTASNSSTNGLSAAQIAAGDVIVNGHVVRKLQPPCPDRFTCADALLAATHQVETGTGLYAGWAVVILAVIIGPPFIAMFRRRRSAGVGRGPAEAPEVTT
jgi:phosphate transport system substrate-binding protein